MRFNLCVIALVAAFCTSGASAAVFNSARFVEVMPGLVSLEGFGRGAVSNSPGPVAFGLGLSLDAARVPFFDTWNIQVGDIAPGTYSFSDMLIDATGSLLFGTGGFAVTFNSIDEFGDRNTVLFNVNDAGTQAKGSGVFTVRGSCPISSCVWIDLSGTQEVGSPAGYGGTVIAAVVPEPATGALLLLGLAAVGAAARRRLTT